MSSQTWNILKSLCRCCHSEGVFKNLSDPCVEKQFLIYSDMLQSLDLTITPVKGPLSAITYAICDECIQHLRDASSFKQQVLVCEQRFRDLYSKDLIKCAEVVEVKEEELEVKEDGLKEETPQYDDGDDDGFQDTTHDNYDNDLPDDVDLKVDHPRVDEGPTIKNTVANKPHSKRGRPKKVKTDLTPALNRDKSQRKRKSDIAVSCNREGETEKEGEERIKFRLTDQDFTTDGKLFQCARCEKKYDKVYSLKFHIKTKHYRIPRYICVVCHQEFMTPAPLTVHKLKEHNIDERHRCNACKGVFNTKVQLRKHINNFHMLGEKHKCDSCDYESFSFEGMYKHKFKHKTVKDHQCRFCRKAFVRKTTLDLHERIHTGDRRKVCNVCGKAFVQKASLNYHMTKYHPEVNF